MGNLLHCFVGDHLKWWNAKLPQAKFSRNGAMKRSIGFFPLTVGCSCITQTLVDFFTLPETIPSSRRTKNLFHDLRRIHKETYIQLQVPTACYKQATNLRRRYVQYEVRGFVWVVKWDGASTTLTSFLSFFLLKLHDDVMFRMDSKRFNMVQSVVKMLIWHFQADNIHWIESVD